MFPWIWIYAPQWPLSGAVTQDISPETFFGFIKPGAGVPEIERRVFERASYGKQLGWLMDVVLNTEDAPDARKKLERLNTQVDAIKKLHREDRADAAIELLKKIEDDSDEELERVLRRFEAGRKRAKRRELPAP